MATSKFTDYVKHQSFQPGTGGVFTNPLYLIRKRLFRGIREFAPALKGKLLDFGCGRKPYENLFTATEYIGVDMKNTGHDHSNSKVDVFYDGKTLPFEDAFFDSLFCSEVLEHVFNPDEILPEIHRVLKPGAKALFTVPFVWNEHEAPYDYARYSSYGIRHLLNKHGFKVLELKKSGSFSIVIFQLWALYFYELFRRYNRVGYVISLFFIVPINIGGHLFGGLFPRNDSLYFNNIVLAEKTGKEA